MDVAEKPGMDPCGAKLLLVHVKIALVGIQAEALHVAMSDADVKNPIFLFFFRHPTNHVLLPVLAGAGAGVEADPDVVTFKLLRGCLK